MRPYMVPVAGLEPARCCHQWILSFILRLEVDTIPRNRAELIASKKAPNFGEFYTQYENSPIFQGFMIHGRFDAKKGIWRDIGGTSDDSSNNSRRIRHGIRHVSSCVFIIAFFSAIDKTFSENRHSGGTL